VLCRSADPTDVVIADFGLSKILAEDTMLKTRCGSPHYLAPEVLMAAAAYDAKVDLWSVGVITYVALTGYLPFFDDDMRKLIGKVLCAEYLWPPDVDVANLAKDFVRKLLEKDPKRRPSAAEALRHPWLLRATAGITLGGSH
jgi:serine/threonine protein kinase